MFQNRIQGFVPNMAVPTFITPGMPMASEGQPTAGINQPVQIADIYQAAKNRAVEDHEIDKLFNPDFDDFQI